MIKENGAKWEKLLQTEPKYNDYEYPKVTTILPTFNCAEALSTTLNGVLDQEYPDFELIVVDAGSTDHTLEIVKGYRSERIRIYTVSEYQRYEMLNKGISHTTGTYLNFLFPGDYYLFNQTLRFMMELALDNEKPHLVFCGTLLRDGKSDVKVLYRHLTRKLLRRGQQPTSLQACWFRKDVFEVIGKFDIELSLRGGYDLLCRYNLAGNFKTVSKNRVLLDYDLRSVSRSMIARHFRETLRTVYTYFGWMAAFRWLFIQKDLLRYLTVWSKRTRAAFLGK